MGTTPSMGASYGPIWSIFGSFGSTELDWFQNLWRRTTCLMLLVPTFDVGA